MAAPQITIRNLDQSVIDAIDAQRGKTPREAYIRQLLENVTSTGPVDHNLILQPAALTQLEDRSDIPEGCTPLQKALFLGFAAEKNLARYFSLLGAALKDLEFSEGEASLLVDACNGTRWDVIGFSPASLPGLLASEIEDAIELDGLDSKWGVSGRDLIAYLKGLSPLQVIAVIDAIERFWSGGVQVDTSEQLKKVGLINGKD